MQLRTATFALALLLPGCLTKMQPSTVTADGGSTDVLASARRAMSEQGLTPSTQDDEAGVLYSDWVVYSSTDESSWVYRMVVLVQDAGGPSSVTVRVETQSCPPHTTVFDRCQAMPGKVVPKSVQEKLDAVGSRIAG